MPLHINLLHEEQAKLVEPKRDPLKLGLLGLLMIGLCLYAYYLVRSFHSRNIQRDLDALTAELGQLEPKAEHAKGLEAESARAVSTTTNLESIINHRFYWGPFLAEVIRGTSRDVQINKMSASLKDGPEVLSVTLEGISSGNEPRAAAERFRQGMTEAFTKAIGPAESQFDNLDDNAAKVTLQDKTFGTAVFTIGFTIKIQPKPAVNEKAK